MLAAQSLCNLSDQRALPILKEHLLLETNERVIQEIERSIHILKPPSLVPVVNVIDDEPQFKKVKTSIEMPITTTTTTNIVDTGPSKTLDEQASQGNKVIKQSRVDSFFKKSDVVVNSSTSQNTSTNINKTGYSIEYFPPVTNISTTFSSNGFNNVNSINAVSNNSGIMLGGFSTRNLRGPISLNNRNITLTNSLEIGSSVNNNVVVKKSEDLEVELSEEQQAVMDIALRGKSLFFSGAAGTGKSFLLKRIIRELRILHGHEHVYVTAPTGIAACNIGGCTVSYSLLYFIS